MSYIANDKLAKKKKKKTRLPSSRYIAVHRVDREGEFLSIPLDDSALTQFLLLLCLLQLVRRLVENGDILGMYVFNNAQCRESSPAADVHNCQPRIIQISRLKSLIPHVLGPVTRIYDMVIYYGEESVEPKCLFLVLDEAGLRRWPRRRKAASWCQRFGSNTPIERRPLEGQPSWGSSFGDCERFCSIEHAGSHLMVKEDNRVKTETFQSLQKATFNY